jgi:hypothetical protein
MSKKVFLVIPILVSGIVAVSVWFYFDSPKWASSHESVKDSSSRTNAFSWSEAVEKAKEDRGALAGGNVPLEIPPELRHYSDRNWFLATQVAEVEKHGIQTCQDFLDLAAMIERHQLITLPAATETYVLLGVGQRADQSVFTTLDAHSIDVYDAELSNAYKGYESLKALAKNFAGRSYNLDDPSDRRTMKINMLSSLRPEAFRTLEQVASVYHGHFKRPLPISSLVRPEQYQRALNRVNRNAVLIDTPPHSTGLAFDIDYRYMTPAEQNFLMANLAGLKNEGRIEVIRESNANYHVFTFIKGTRPADDLITASIDKAKAPGSEMANTAKKSANVKSKPKKARGRKARSTAKRRR